jgi:uncharacterized SAM-binding protein YcdF (DUF218 family)
VALAYLGRGWWLPWVGHQLHDSDAVESVDVVLVLGGDASTRPLLAAKMVRTGKAKRIVVASQKVFPTSEDDLWPPEHDLIKKVLLARGVAEDKITLLPGACFSTADEAAVLARYLDAHPDIKVAVVTSDYHTRRVRLIFGRALGERMAQVRILGVPTDNFGPDDWWTTERGFVTYSTESIKLLQTWLR